MDDNQVERATLNEDVILKMTFPGDPNEQLLNIQRNVVFNKIIIFVQLPKYSLSIKINLTQTALYEFEVGCVLSGFVVNTGSVLLLFAQVILGVAVAFI